MPKLILPNALEIYRQRGTKLTKSDANARQFYNSRFLWLLEEGDIIVLPEPATDGLLEYICSIKGIGTERVRVVTWTVPANEDYGIALASADLLEKLSKLIDGCRGWEILTCYFNEDILQLAERLNVPIDPDWKKLVLADQFRNFNSKIEFRTIAAKTDVAIAPGRIVQSCTELAGAVAELIVETGSVIVKQAYNGGGRGNVVISRRSASEFPGAGKFVLLKGLETENVLQESNSIWQELTGPLNDKLIVETYYPRSRTLTCILFLDTRYGECQIVSCSEIRMESTWVGVEFPAELSAPQLSELIESSLRIARHLQSRGYRGYLCCDSILTADGSLLFTELNVRPGAETNAYVAAKAIHKQDILHGDSCNTTRRGISTVGSFRETMNLLRQHELLLEPGQSEGVVPLTVDDKVAHQIELLFTSTVWDKTRRLEQQTLGVINAL